MSTKKITYDDTRDISTRCVNKLIKEGFLESNSNPYLKVQDVIHDEINSVLGLDIDDEFETNISRSEKVNARKVRISTRQVYHKYVEVEIEIPEEIALENIEDYLVCNEEMYTEDINKELELAEIKSGSGVSEYYGMDEGDTEHEWRYDVLEAKKTQIYGGHL